ncbi:unnamed protein product [Rotaria socialis]|uniref:C2H2-type domain-containing protein n=2 Tax=Rotaria socialis TaxID=392032 RepID=A0A821CAC6_9BILA|nr:unnamed protein product [Rotaria socialis]
MFQLDILIDISILPSNIMALRDDDFIDFAKEEASHSATTLLEIQGINCVKSLLMTNSVYAIMDVKSKSLDDLKIKYGYMQDDGAFVIQHGVKGNIEYLIDLLKKKCIEDVKLAKSSKHNQSSLSSTIPKSASTVTSNIEGEHYFILIQNDSNGALKCDIRCCCQKWSSLPLRRGKFQLSNFYRHLQDTSFSIRCELSVCCGSCYSSFDSYRCHIYCFHRSLVDSFDSDSVIPSNIDNNDSYIQPDANNQSDHIEDPDSFIYRDEECDETDDLINNFDPISFTTIDEKCSFDILVKLYTRFLLELREYHLLPQKVVQLISSNISDLLEVILKLIKTKQSASVLTVVDLETIFTHVNKLITSISKNEHTFLKQCQKHFNYELPIEIVLNTSEDHAYYIPLKISLSHLLHSGELLDAINNNTQSLIIQSNKDNDLILSNRQCRSIKSNTSNRKNSDFLLLKLYSDGIGITNPIGPKKDSHKFTCFYFLLDDLPNVLRSQVNLIGLHCIAYTKHLKDKDSRDVLMNVLIQDFNQLQTQGITVPCISSRLYFSFSFLCGDNLASNELGGFQKNFNSGHFCRHCLITYEQRLIPLTDISFVPRTHLRHDLIVDRIVSNNDGQTLFGVSGDSWFRNLIGFHPTESLPPDLMHDTAEGVCPLIIRALLKEAVQQRILTYAQIERRTSSFIFGFYDSSNKPPPVKKQHVFHSNITGSASQNYVFSGYFRQFSIILLMI